jgi:tRNA threonylcarbamoyladenosine biosynthesis protein TsaB
VTAAGGRRLLALDTATRRTAVALGPASGSVATRSHDRSGPPLLDTIEAVLHDAGMGKGDLSGVVVGTGPGSFTGLRIGLATAKTLAYALAVDIVGVPTVEALALAAAVPGSIVAIVLPAGARDHYLARVEVAPHGRMPDGGAARLVEPPRLLAPATDLRTAVGADVVLGVDVATDTLDAEALERGRAAQDGLGEALLALGVRRAANGPPDDVATLVPQYVALPRGVTDAAREMTWSPDLR